MGRESHVMESAMDTGRSPGPDPAQDHVHDLADEVVGQRQVTEQQPVLGGPEEQVEHHLPVHRQRTAHAS